MNKLIKEILTNKAVRSSTALVALAITASDAGLPWIS